MLILRVVSILISSSLFCFWSSEINSFSFRNYSVSISFSFFSDFYSWSACWGDWSTFDSISIAPPLLKLLSSDFSSDLNLWFYSYIFLICSEASYNKTMIFLLNFKISSYVFSSPSFSPSLFTIYNSISFYYCAIVSISGEISKIIFFIKDRFLPISFFSSCIWKLTS